MITETEVGLVVNIILLTIAASVAAVVLHIVFPDYIELINRLAGGTIGFLAVLVMRRTARKEFIKCQDI